jgi:hypothetical protein
MDVIGVVGRRKLLLGEENYFATPPVESYVKAGTSFLR